MNHILSKRIYKIHQWCGLLAGLFIMLLGISGSILVFHEELDSREHKEVWKVSAQEPVSIDKAYKTLTQKYQHWEIRLQRFSNDPAETLIFSLRRPDQRLMIFSHPSSGKILKVADSDKTFVNWILRFHYSLHADLIGEILVFIFGLLYFISLVSGLIIYRKAIQKIFLFRTRFNRKNKRAIASSLHRYTGVWALVLNLFIVISGILISYDVVSNGLKKNKTPGSIEAPEIKFSIDHTLQIVDQKYPDFHPSYIRFPLVKEKPLIIQGELAGQAFFYSRYYNSVPVDALTGVTGELIQADSANSSTKLSSIVRAVHFVEFGNFPVKLLFCLAGLTAPALSITGFFLWKWKRNKKAF